MRALATVFVMLLAGCLTGQEEVLPQPGSSPPAVMMEPTLVADVAAAEPDLVILPTGRILLCSLPQRASAEMLLYGSDDGRTFEPLPSAGPGLIDCSMAVDTGGRAYYATSTGARLNLASSADGETWDRQAQVGSGAYDRPWVAGGEPDHALAVAYDARIQRIVAFSTTDGAATWSDAVPATPLSELVFQAFGNVAWLGNESFAVPYGILRAQGDRVEMRDIHLALTNDGGATWTREEVAVGRTGNANHVFPSATATLDGELLVVWAETASDGAPDVWLARGRPGAWSDPSRINRDGTSAVIPEVTTFVNGTTVIAMYETAGRIDPASEPASWNLTAYVGGTPRVLQEAAHNGTLSTGGYGTLVPELVKGLGRGTSNSNALLHNIGSWRAPDDRVLVAWTTSEQGSNEQRILATWV